MRLREPNPHRVGTCEHCGSYRTDGHPAYLHYRGCPRERDPQAGRWSSEQRTGGHASEVLYCDDPAHDHDVEVT